jgi:formylglycine-generating enzyme required for sulfatase activity
MKIKIRNFVPAGILMPVLCLVFTAAAQDEYEKVLRENVPVNTGLSPVDAHAKMRAHAAIELLRKGKEELVWPHLRSSKDPSMRSYFIRDVGYSDVQPEVLLNRLNIEREVSVRRALILSLGGFSGSQFSVKQRLKIRSQLLIAYQNDPDAGIHSAIEWLLRYGNRGWEKRRFQWNKAPELNRIDSLLAGQEPGNRNWYVTSKKQTFSIIEGPVEFIMGSPGNEPGRDKSPIELQHRQVVPRSFAIAVKEITVGQFQEFLDANPTIKVAAQAGGSKDPGRNGQIMKARISSDECPQILMTWFEAAQYCNWLSEQEGIPKKEWCYPTLEEIKEGMSLPADYLQREGYRMPTEAESEYASRSGSITSRFFGESEELLRDYAWFTGNTFNEKPWPAAQLKPNEFGLFDVYGNVWEWGQNWVKYYQSASKDSVWYDLEDSVLVVSKDYKRPRKGGSYTYSADFLRSSYRNEGYIPDERRDSVGFRIARTIKKKKTDNVFRK